MQKNQHTASIFATATQLSLSRENLDIKRVTFLLDETWRDSCPVYLKPWSYCLH